MSHHNLVLTEKAIKNHSKRLQKEMSSTMELSLVEAQNLFSRILGFNNYHELKSVLNIEVDLPYKSNDFILEENEFINFVKNSKNLEEEDKKNFINNFDYFKFNKGSTYYSEVKKKKKYYEDLEKSIKNQEYNNKWMITDYLDSCIKEDNIQEFIRKYKTINIENAYEYAYDMILDKHAQKITKHILNMPNIINKEDKSQRAVGAFAFYNNLDMVKYFLNYPGTKVNNDIVMFACFYENNSSLEYLIDRYKNENPQEKDFTNFIKDGILQSCQRNALNNFKLLMSLPNQIETDFIIKALVPSPLKKNSDEDDKKNYSKKIATGKRFLEYLINELNFTINQKTKDLFGIN